MKKTIILLLGLACVLTGCGNATESTTAPQPEIKPTEALPETQEVPETTAVTEETTTAPEEETTAAPEEETTIASETKTTAAPETTPEPQTEPEEETLPPSDAPAREDVIAAYKTAIASKIDVASSYNGAGSVSLTYALYDMDHDGIPELLIQYGTCEADFAIAIYTYRDHALTLIEDDIGGGHTTFAYDYVANQLVLAWGHQGYGFMTWYDLDEKGRLRELIDTQFEFGFDAPEYPYYLKKYNVAYLEGSTFFGTDITWNFRYPDNEYQYEEYGGYDYRFLENYPF